MEFTVVKIVGLVGLGLVAGTAGGLLGIGGGVVNVPGLTLIFLAANPAAGVLARASSLVVSGFIGMSSAFRHHKAKTVLPRVVGLMLAGGVIGATCGAVLAHWLYQCKWLFPAVFAGFMACVIAQNLKRLLHRKHDDEQHHTSDTPYPLTPGRVAGLGAIGFPMGIAAGLLGIGGGAVAVPMQQTIVRMPLRNAIACSSAVIVATAWAAAIMTIIKGVSGPDSVFVWWQPLIIAAILVPSAIVGAQIGARLHHALPLRTVRIVFVILIAISCAKMAEKSVRLYRQPPKQPKQPASSTDGMHSPSPFPGEGWVRVAGPLSRGPSRPSPPPSPRGGEGDERTPTCGTGMQAGCRRSVTEEIHAS